MNNPFSFSDREREVARLLAEGRSNREIAYQMKISERTVEFHLTHIYEKLGVKSRAEAIIILRESTAPPAPEPEVSSVAENGGNGDNGGSQVPPILSEPPAVEPPAGPPAWQPEDRWHRFRSWKSCLIFSVIVAIIIFAAAVLLPPIKWEGYKRECENPEGSTVGQTLDRMNASKGKVHGQFGTTGAEPWPAQSGYVIYKGINTPQVDELFLNLRYSKYSAATMQILVYLDDETTPRISMVPIDQGSWDAFAWTGPISLGGVKRGVHTLKFVTDGQQYGVADLDKFELSVKAP